MHDRKLNFQAQDEDYSQNCWWIRSQKIIVHSVKANALANTLNTVICIYLIPVHYQFQFWCINMDVNILNNFDLPKDQTGNFKAKCLHCSSNITESFKTYLDQSAVVYQTNTLKLNWCWRKQLHVNTHADTNGSWRTNYM